MNAFLHRPAPIKVAALYTSDSRRATSSPPAIRREFAERNRAKTAPRLHFCVVHAEKTPFEAGFIAIPFDFRLRPTLESAAFRRHRGFELMKARRTSAKAAASKGAAKKAPKRKKATRRKKAKKK
jgi:hypothetical protein